MEFQCKSMECLANKDEIAITWTELFEMLNTAVNAHGCKCIPIIVDMILKKKLSCKFGNRKNM